MRFSFTMFFTPVMLGMLLAGGILLIQGVRQRRRGKLFAALGLFALVWGCVSLLMEFITRM